MIFCRHFLSRAVDNVSLSSLLCRKFKAHLARSPKISGKYKNIFPKTSKFPTHLICLTKSKFYLLKPVKPRIIIFPGTPALSKIKEREGCIVKYNWFKHSWALPNLIRFRMHNWCENDLLSIIIINSLDLSVTLGA